MTDRISWDDLWMQMAGLVGKRSLCVRAQYGAVIVSSDNRVLSVGYNGVPAGCASNGTCDNWCERAVAAKNIGEHAVDPNYLDCHAVHAEQNAILRAPNLWLERSPTLYVNGVTCHRCALIIANSGIKTVVILLTDYEMKRDPMGTQQLLEQYGIGVRLKTWH
jgi:dCMP deaminase